MIRKVAAVIALSVAASSAVLGIAAAPASAEPCGASTYMRGTTRVVAYRNCGSSNIGAQVKWEDSGWQRCYLVRPGSGAIIGEYANGGSKHWSARTC